MEFEGRSRRGERRDGSDDEDDPYVFFDAAYVLGSLSSTERGEYETHLGSCPSCRDALHALSGMPALLAMMDRDDFASLGGDQPPPRPELLESLLAKVRRRRRRMRMLTGALAAATIVAVALVLVIRPSLNTSPPERPPAMVSALTLLPVVPTAVDATIVLLSHQWGTSIEMTYICRDQPGKAGAADPDDDFGGDSRLAMVVVGRDGRHAQLATWMAMPGVPALPTTSTALPMDQIAAVQVVSVAHGAVLLQRNL